MFSVLLAIALTPDVPVASHKAASGCVGTPAKAALGCFGSTRAVAGCTGVVKAAPASGCYGGSARAFRTPVRNVLRKPHGVTTYYAPAAVYVPVATVFQSAAPPVYRTPVRNAAAVVCPGGRCPR